MDFNEIYGQMQEFYAPSPGVYTPQEAAERTKARTDFALAGFATGFGGALVGPPRMKALNAVAAAFTSGALLYLTRDSGRAWNFIFASGITSNLVTAVKAFIDPESVEPFLPDRVDDMGRTRGHAVANQARRRMIHARRGRLQAPGAPSRAIGGGDGDASIMVRSPSRAIGGGDGDASIMVRSPSRAIGGGDGDASIMVYGGRYLRPDPMGATLTFHPHHDTAHYRLPRSTSV